MLRIGGEPSSFLSSVTSIAVDFTCSSFDILFPRTLSLVASALPKRRSDYLLQTSLPVRWLLLAPTSDSQRLFGPTVRWTRWPCRVRCELIARTIIELLSLPHGAFLLLRSKPLTTCADTPGRISCDLVKVRIPVPSAVAGGGHHTQ